MNVFIKGKIVNKATLPAFVQGDPDRAVLQVLCGGFNLMDLVNVECRCKNGEFSTFKVESVVELPIDVREYQTKLGKVGKSATFYGFVSKGVENGPSSRANPI